jgi:hypothetical protein
MRTFRAPPGEHAVTAMVRHMEHGRFAEAGEALESYSGGHLPPPHALWRLGRWLAQNRQPRRAKLALKLFVDLYHAHEDRPQVLSDLARVHLALGERDEARALADEARRLARKPAPVP